MLRSLPAPKGMNLKIDDCFTRIMKRMNRKTILLKWLQIAGGLLVFAFGVHLTIFANIGLAPWDCLGMGISCHTPLNYGLAMTSVAVTVLILDLLMHERIGYGCLRGTSFRCTTTSIPFPSTRTCGRASLLC